MYDIRWRYGAGPGLTGATALQNGGDCIWMLFPYS